MRVAKWAPLFVVACHAATTTRPPAPHATVATASSSSAPIAPSAPTTYDAFVSISDNEFMGWQILFARHDDQIRVLVRSRGSAALPVELRGTATPDGSRLRVRAELGALSFEGVVDGEVLRGSLHTPMSKETVRAKRGISPIPEGTMKIGAEVSGKRFDVAWEQRGNVVKATVKDAGRARVLEGTSHDGRFDLTGDGATWRGEISGLSAGIGEWIENGKTQALTLDLLRIDVPAPYPLPNGGRVVPLELWSRGRAGCPSSYDVLPQIEGLGTPLESTLNQKLAKRQSTKCTDAIDLASLGAVWSTSTYTVTAATPAWFALHADAYAYLGGAHGMSGEMCGVFSLVTGRGAWLQTELEADALVKLGKLVRAAILAGAPGKSLVDLGFYADDPKVTNDRAMCVVMDHGAPALEVIYQHDMDEAGDFRFTDLRPHIAAAKVRGLFPADTMGAIVFQ
jgi:hypothetical protein